MKRDLLLWGTAVILLLAAFYTVSVRRELYDRARGIGRLEKRLIEQQRRNDNLALLRERLASPGSLRERARQAGILADGKGGR